MRILGLIFFDEILLNTCVYLYEGRDFLLNILCFLSFFCLVFKIWNFIGSRIPMSTMGESLTNNKEYGEALGRAWRSF